MSIWFRQFTLDEIREFEHDTMGEYLGIEFFEIGDDYVCARMPVDGRTMQPDRILQNHAASGDGLIGQQLYKTAPPGVGPQVRTQDVAQRQFMLEGDLALPDPFQHRITPAPVRHQE